MIAEDIHKEEKTVRCSVILIKCLEEKEEISKRKISLNPGLIITPNLTQNGKSLFNILIFHADIG